ncbi:MAG: hypothetical protein Ta2B_24040 [Termitinemataceae bacterium]|nr:MAG: hypothetical protein Ta2B_24040 [Termitinemataceae bacterium]
MVNQNPKELIIQYVLDSDEEENEKLAIFIAGLLAGKSIHDKKTSENASNMLKNIFTSVNKNPRRRAAGYFCSPGELHFGFNTPCYAPEGRGIKPYGSNKGHI